MLYCFEKITFEVLMQNQENTFKHLLILAKMKLEVFLRLAAKRCQNVGRLSTTDLVLSLLGWFSILPQIEQRKINFFHKLLTMDPLSLLHQLLDYTLTPTPNATNNKFLENRSRYSFVIWYCVSHSCSLHMYVKIIQP